MLIALLFEPQLLAWVHGRTVPEIPAGRGWYLGVIALPIVVNLVRSRLPERSEIIGLADCRDAMVEGVRNSVPVAIACAAVGIITGVATLTGVALDAADWVVNMASAIPFESLQLLLTLVLTMVAAIALGMGLPSIPCYIITSTMAAPILLHLPLFRELAGSSDTAVFIAHMFVFYFGVFANLTPPVALAAYAAAGISGGSPNATGVQALKLGIAGFVVPYMFVFAHSMLMLDATWWNVAGVAATGVLGVLLLAVAVEGHLRGPLNPAFRLAALIGALAFIFPGWITDAVGALIALLLFLIQPKASSSASQAKAT